jgi:hypothetical protein
MNSNRNIREVLAKARELTILADEGEAASQDDGCMVLFSVVRDCAYKLRGRAEQERDAHRLKGIWDSEPTGSAEKGRQR